MQQLARYRTRSVVAAFTVAILTTVGALLAFPVPAAARPGAAPSRPIRIEGYWGRDRDAPGVLAGIPISSDATPRRTFGVTALQAYIPEEEGVQVLRHSAQQPSLRIIGRQEMVRRFMDAPDTDKVVAFGVYRASTGTLILSSVEVAGETESR
jgi:hypothetical protein